MRALTSTLAGLLLLPIACGGDSGKGKGADSDSAQPAEKAAAKPDAAELQAQAATIFGVLPAAAESSENPSSEEKINLGRMLYFDTRLSKNHDIACESCHVLANYGVDAQPTSPGHKGQKGTRNSPTVYNAGFHVAQFWDGREPDLEAQAKGPILNPVEMALPDAEAAVAVLASIPGYVGAFEAAFPGQGITYDNVGKAIGAFERKLVTPSPFDKFMAGDLAALDESALHGLQLFNEAACVTCHAGPAIGGGMFQKLGNVKPFETKDQGRFEHTKAEADRLMFKVPSLRNIAKTGPYLHDGSVTTLDDMVTLMVEHQTAKGSFTDAELKDVVAFLNSLTGELPAEYIKKPELPASGPKTPAPDPS